MLKAQLAKSRRYLEARPARSRLRVSQGIALLSGLFALRPFECPTSRERPTTPHSAAHHPATAHALATNRPCLPRQCFAALTPSGLSWSDLDIEIINSSTHTPVDVVPFPGTFDTHRQK